MWKETKKCYGDTYMIKNVQSLKDRANNFAKENNLTVQQVLQNYMFERFLERLSFSEYKEKLIIRGGLLLSSIIGINETQWIWMQI